MGRCVRPHLSPYRAAGQVDDITQASNLLDGQTGKAAAADKAYDSNALRATVKAMNAKVVIPSDRTRKINLPHDPIVYKHPNRSERCFNRLKHFRGLATRYEGRTIDVIGSIPLAAMMIRQPFVRGIEF